MKELLLNYVKMLKAGFFYKTFLFALLLVIPSVVRAFSTGGGNFSEISFVVISFLAAFTLKKSYKITLKKIMG